ncbi:MerR family transcriptional regulator [Lactobacillus xylocopicola]|uniref:HTH merR-type domain-containing protein n=1 Tax=Lactobacillus xylocopicola TaxID=2976676 RepID=A0ABM8BH61_9LACO|nr:MerR family transcriptional regulator [Lactobacillus xylocopicola]BDR60607.1 hypothetical protein KIM322_08680 [Lactobacillus xylocopicola]
MSVSIDEAANITGVPIRKLRYWEEKWIINSVDEGPNKTRKFDYYEIKKIILIHELMVEGYTLEKSAGKVAPRIETLQRAFDKMEEQQKSEEA